MTTLPHSAASTGTGVRREWISGHNFVMIHLDLVDALDGSYDAAALVNRIGFRAGTDGWWTASKADMIADLRLTEHRITAALRLLRDKGMVESERATPFDPTLKWRIAYVSEDSSSTSPPETSSTVSEDSSLTTFSKNVEEQPPPPPSPAVATAVVQEFSLISEDDEEVWPVEATGNGCRQAWLAAYTEAFGEPDPTIKKRALGRIAQAAKDRTDVESWRALWQACSAAGHAGRWDVTGLLTPAPPPRAASSRNGFFALSHADFATGLTVPGQVVSR